MALVLNNKIPDGIISNKPRRDHGNKCPAKDATGKFLEKPNNRRLNINADPTRMTIPVK